MDRRVFREFCDLVYKESGIKMSQDKIPLLKGRIAKRIRALSLNSENDYLSYIKFDATGEEVLRFIDVISTNVTHFFREHQHFDVLVKQLKKWDARTHPKLRIWCAGSSSGEEPYSLAMICREYLDCSKVNVKILATDICTDVLARAIKGEYSGQSVEKVAPNLRAKYFFKVRGSKHHGDAIWSVHDSLKELVVFRRLNLAQIPYPLKDAVDVIFCRNVMIYFDIDVRRLVVSEFDRLLKPGGYLFVSHSENLLGINSSFTNVGTSMYKKGAH